MDLFIPRCGPNYEETPLKINPDTIALLGSLDDEQLDAHAASQQTELLQGSFNDEEFELYIYTSLLIFRKRGSIDYFLHALRKSTEWEAGAVDEPDRSRRVKIRDWLGAWVYQLDFIGKSGIERECRAKAEQNEEMGSKLFKEYEQTKDLKVLNEAIRIVQQNIDIPKAFVTSRSLLDLAGMLEKRFDETREMDDLNRCIDVGGMAVEAASSKDYVNKSIYLSCLSGWLWRRFELTGLIPDIDSAIENAEMSVSVLPTGHPARSSCLHNLGVHLGERFKWTDSIDDLNRAIEIAEMAVNASLIHTEPSKNSNIELHSTYLTTLGERFGDRFKRTGSIDDLNHAIEFSNMAVEIAPGHTNIAPNLDALGRWLGIRYELTGSMDDLNRAIEVADTAVSTVKDPFYRPVCLQNFSTWLATRYERTGSKEDLDRAIEMAGSAVSTSVTQQSRALALHNLGNQLSRKYQHTRLIEDLKCAIEAAEMSAEIIPPNHPGLASCLHGLGQRLHKKFEQTGFIDDLNRAIEVSERAVKIGPQEHTGAAVTLRSLAHQYQELFRRTGSINDLNHAVENADMAVNLIPAAHSHWVSYQNMLGTILSSRFTHMGTIEDLYRSIEIAEMVVKATPENHPSLGLHLMALGGRLQLRAQLTESIDEISSAIQVGERAVTITPKDNHFVIYLLENLGVWLRLRSLWRLEEREKDIKVADISEILHDLNRAIECAETALNATPESDPNWASLFSSLGNHFAIRYKATGSIDDLNRAIENISMVLSKVPQELHSRALFFDDLGRWLWTRSNLTGSMNDLDRALSLYKEGWSCHTAPPYVRIRFAWNSARIFAMRQDWESSSLMLEEAIQLLPVVSPRIVKPTDKQQMLKDFAGLASTAAAVSITAGRGAYRSLRLLELGRGIIASLLMENRGDISDLKRLYPDFAEEYITLRDALDQTPSSDMLDAFRQSEDQLSTLPNSSLHRNSLSVLELQKKLRSKQNQKLSKLIEDIRVQPGFANFLLPPTETDIKEAACSGPIVLVNLSKYRCDAFLIEPDKIRVLPLPDLTLKEVKKRAKDLRLSSSVGAETLEWLWDTICGPCLDILGFRDSISDGNWPHIWWIPTGVLSQLPLHAAGYHYNSTRPNDTVIDRVMSSYASSVKGLIHGRHNVHGSTARTLKDGHALLIAMEQTPDLAANQNLPFVKEEANVLKDLYSSLQIKCIIPEPQKANVLEMLQDHNCEIFHFAGHGLSHPTEPSRSYLLLEDWKTDPLTMEDIRALKFRKKQPFLGYLSACLTGANEVYQLADEGIHLISAFQLAGFRHVIGSLWEVLDRHCVDVARVFYDTILKEGMTDTAVCKGLHQAIRALRNEEVGVTGARNGKLLKGDKEGFGVAYWAPYVHFGV
ncbi:hypothetical protein TWF694_001918 [Orbilia ellipsospora]|uniref:CHAT domain-containing protein n=1 Tax=Orbilia ellipsospora TaxID=2528407 RepID=A0AAV9X6M5_9PEZI